MANSIVAQVMQDGPRNYVAKINVHIDTANYTNAVLIDPATMSVIEPSNTLSSAPTQFCIDYFAWSIQADQATSVAPECQLLWDASSPVIAKYFGGVYNLIGEEDFSFNRRFSGLQNNAGAGKTGKLLLTTTGWAASAVFNLTLDFQCRKQTTNFI